MSTHLSKAIKYLADPGNLYAQFKKGSFTKDLEVRRQFSVDDAGGIRVQSNSYIGDAQDYDGYGSVSTDASAVIKAQAGWVLYTLDQKKYYPMPIDKIESEEALRDFIAAANGLMKYKVTADIDAYRLSKLAKEAGVVCNGAALNTGDIDADLVGSGVDIDKSTVLQTIEACIAKMSEEETTGDRATLFTTPAVVRILEDADKLTRFINTRDITADGVTKKIKYIDTGNGSIDIVSIPAKYFREITLVKNTDPNKAGTNQNKLSKTVDKTFRFLMVAQTAVNAVVKVNEARIMPPGTIRGFLGTLFELFLYHDIFVIERHEALADAESATFLTPIAFNGVIKCSYTAPTPPAGG